MTIYKIYFTPVFNPYLSIIQLATKAKAGWEIENINVFAAIAIFEYPKAVCMIEFIGVNVWVGNAITRHEIRNKNRLTNLLLKTFNLHGSSWWMLSFSISSRFYSWWTCSVEIIDSFYFSIYLLLWNHWKNNKCIKFIILENII